MLIRMLLLLSFFIFSSVVVADTYVPESLKPWKEWVLHGKEEMLCPQKGADTRRWCSWPTAIELELSQKSGRFVQTWNMLAPGYVAIPGDAKLSALDVTVDGTKASVVGNNGQGLVYLKSGSHKISGSFSWERLPASIVIPVETALINLKIDGIVVPYPKMNGSNLFLKAIEEQNPLSTDSFDLRVHRHIIDDIPLIMETQFDLTVSGKNREINLPGWQPSGFLPMEIDSSLPVRTNNEGDLVIQARPGKWTVFIRSRASGPVTDIVRGVPQAPMPDDEVWVFEAREQLRLVNVEGVVTIDPSQTLLPDAWKSFPAYQVGSDAKFVLTEKKRGNPVPAPDRISLARAIWLDFDGNGYTIKDTLSGEVKKSWRLELAKPAMLGKVSVNNENQLITSGASGNAGVELTQGALNMQADSRISSAERSFNAGGWVVDLQSLVINLQLPPAWRVFHASGTDAANGTWIRSWDLLHLFMLLVVAIAVSRLSGVIWGGIAFITMALILPEGGDAPKYIWLAALPVMALSRLTIAKPFDKMFFLYKWVIGIALVLICAEFSLSQIRRSMYPVLEQPWSQLGDSPVEDMVYDMKSEAGFGGAAGNMEEEAVEGDYLDEDDSGVLGNLSRSAPKNSKKERPVKMKDQRQMKNLAQYDPKANIQTGPGLPQWSWKSVRLSWNGPVKADQKINLMLMPPWLNRGLGFLRAILALSLVGLILSGGRYEFGGYSLMKTFKKFVPLLLGVILLQPGRSSAADIPSQELLNALSNRLLEKSACSPNCFSVGRMQVQIDADILTIRMEAFADDRSIVVLPGDVNHWLPHDVVVDGSVAALIRINGSGFQTVIEKGVHQIILRGKLPDRDNVQILLPVTPGFTAFSGAGWTVEGIHENGKADGSISLQRMSKEKKDKTESATAEDLAGTLPGFVKIERTFSIGLDWLVTTTATRLAGSGSAINLKIPVLTGEQVTSADIRVVDQNIALVMGPHVDVITWESIVAPSDTLKMTAGSSSSWIEWWTLEHSPIWHIEYEGIPVIDHVDGSGARRPHWRPWPSETVTLNISRPAAVEGATATIDRTILDITPGERSSEAVLDLSVRASIGSDLRITLPQGAEFQSLALDGKAGIIQAVDGVVTVALKPGKQDIKAIWRQNEGIGMVFKTPQVDIGLPGVNYTVKVQMPRDRWTLGFAGAGTGPAILFWSRLFIVILIGFALGRLPLSPLKSWQWILLGIGLTQTKLIGAFLVAGFFLAIHWRATKPDLKSAILFNIRQLMLVGWGAAAVLTLLHAIKTGFFGVPQMQVVGNGSSYRSLNWFLDRHESLLPGATIFSIPMLAYQIIMLSWALWLAFSVVKWSQWIWESMGVGGWFKKLDPITVPKRKPAGSPPPPATGKEEKPE